MAQIDIGKLSIGPHKGDYNNSTAYVANDIVYYNGSAYIAKQSTTGNLPTDTNNWNTFSAGSGGIWNSGLSLGSAGQVVKVNSGASALEFGTISSDYVKIASGFHNGATNLIIDNLDVTPYNSFRIHLQNMMSQTSNTTTLYFRFRYDNSGTQTTYSVAAHTYAMRGRYVKGGSADTGESSGTSEENAIRLNWALSKNTNDRYSQSMEIAISELNNTAHHKDLRIMSYGTYYNNTEYSMYNFGVGVCRQATQVFNGFDIYCSDNWKGDYQIYGIK